MLAAGFCAAAQQDVEVLVKDEGGIDRPTAAADVNLDDPVASDGRMKRHRPFLAGLLVGSAFRRPYYGGYGGGYGGYGHYPNYYGGYGGYGY